MSRRGSLRALRRRRDRHRRGGLCRPARAAALVARGPRTAAAASRSSPRAATARRSGSGTPRSFAPRARRSTGPPRDALARGLADPAWTAEPSQAGDVLRAPARRRHGHRRNRARQLRAAGRDAPERHLLRRVPAGLGRLGREADARRRYRAPRSSYARRARRGTPRAAPCASSSSPTGNARRAPAARPPARSRTTRGRTSRRSASAARRSPTT